MRKENLTEEQKKDRDVLVAQFFIDHSDGFYYSDLKDEIKKRGMKTIANFPVFICRYPPETAIWEDEAVNERGWNKRFGCLNPEKLEEYIKKR